MKKISIIIVLAIAIAESAFSQEFDKKGLLYRVISNENFAVELMGFEKKPKEEIVIPEVVSYKGAKYTVKTIGANAFKECEQLQKVVGLTIQEVKEDAFNGCINLSSAVFTSQIKAIGKKAFHGCTSLQEIVLGNNIQNIEDAAFAGCSNLKELSLGNTLKSIGAGIINDTGINSITLPGSLVDVGQNAFAECKHLSSVVFNEGTKYIEPRAFAGTSIISLLFPKSLESIGKNAFAGCGNLQTITFNEGLKTIGTSAFVESAIESLSFPNSLKEIQSSSFEDCKSLHSITLGDNIESIGEKAFAGFSMLSVDYSDVPCDIASDAFTGCKKAIIGHYSLKGLSKLLKGGQYTLEEEEFKHGLIKVKKGGKYGFFNKMGKLVIPCVYDYAERSFWDDYISVSKGDNCGYYSPEGNAITQCIYDGCRYGNDSESGIHIVIKSEKYGVVDFKNRKEILPCIYDVIYSTYDDRLFMVRRNGKYGFFDIDGKEILPCTYDNAVNFSEGIGWCMCKGIWYAINTEGKSLFKLTDVNSDLPIIYPFKDGIGTAVIENNGKSAWRIIYKDGNSTIINDCKFAIPWGYGLIRVEMNGGGMGLIDKKQNVILPAKHDEINGFRHGMAIFKDAEGPRNYRYGVIDSTGSVVVPCSYKYVNNMENGFISINDNGKEWYVNKKGEKIDESLVPSGDYYNKYGIGIVKKNGKYGCVDGNGRLITPFIYDKIEKPSDGLLRVKSNGKYGYIDITGKEIIPVEWSNASNFSDGLAEVIKDEKVLFIDKSGKELFRLDFEAIGVFHDGMVLVESNGKFGYVDSTGKLTVPCIYTFKSVNGWDMTNNFSEGLACVYKNGKVGFVDKTGKSTFDY